MEDIDIENEYELHNLLKNSYYIWRGYVDEKINFSRMPFISFGNVDRKSQIFNLLLQIYPVNITELAKEYENKYGILPKTFEANFNPLIEEYYHKGLYTIDQISLSSEENLFLKSILEDDFYFVEDVLKEFSNRYSVERSKLINKMVYKKHGYKLYTDYIVNEKYGTGEEYFINLLTSNEKIDLTNLDSRIFYIGMFNKAFSDLKRNFELLEMDNKLFISIEHFIDVTKKFTKQDIIDYSIECSKFAERNDFFTLSSIRKEGFKHKLDELLEDYFYESVIKNSKLVKTIEIDGKRIYYNKNKDNMSFSDFIYFVLYEHVKLSTSLLSKKLKKEYGIDISRDKLIAACSKTGRVYYNSVMDKFYLSKSDYYDELK